jgi:hypothetical protein
LQSGNCYESRWDKRMASRDRAKKRDQRTNERTNTLERAGIVITVTPTAMPTYPARKHRGPRASALHCVVAAAAAAASLPVASSRTSSLLQQHSLEAAIPGLLRGRRGARRSLAASPSNLKHVSTLLSQHGPNSETMRTLPAEEDNDVDPRIVGGDVAQEGAYPSSSKGEVVGQVSSCPTWC